MISKSKCPFCGSSKIKPFMGHNQDCHECDENGMIKNSRLKSLGLDDMIDKPILIKTK